jgi:hypothetical protein
MAYLGAAPQPGISFSGVQTQSFNGNGSTVEFALSRHVAQATNLEVIVNNVQQSPFDGSYSVVGGYTLTFSEAPSSGTNNIYVVYRDYSVETIVDTTAYRSNEVDSLLAAKVNKAGDTMTGSLLVTGSTNALRVNEDGIGTKVISVRSDFAGVGPTINVQTNHPLIFNTNNTERMRIDSSGRVTMPFQPSVGVRMSNVQSINSGIRTKVAFDTIDFQRGSNYNTSTYRFTAPVAGVYLVQSRLYIYTVNQSEVHIYINGSIFIRSAGVNVGSTNPHGYQVNHTLNLALGDYIEIYGEHSNGNTQTIYTGGSRESYLTISMLN